MNTIKITPNGELSIIPVSSNPFPEVADMLGNIAEHVLPRRLPAPYCMIVDEEGRLRHLPVNLVGCYLYQTDVHGSPIVGDIYMLKDVPAPDGSYDIAPLNEQDLGKLSFLNGLAARCKETTND